MRRCKSAGQTIGIKWRERLVGEGTPGPGAYEPHFSSVSHRAPSFSMKGRHGGKKRGLGPGPGAYDVSSGSRLVSRSAPAHSIGIKTNVKNKKPTPGPADYDSRRAGRVCARSAPSFSLSGRHSVKSVGGGPGPADYARETVKTGQRAPAWTLSGRFAEKNKSSTPSALDYAPSFAPVEQRAPAFTISGKTHTNVKSEGPGPGAYELLPAKRGGISMSWRWEAGQGDNFPAPNAYLRAGDSEAISRRAPAFTLKSGREHGSRKFNDYPGPGAYAP